MEENHLLQEISYLSRLIGQHKLNTQPKNRSHDPRRGVNKMPYPINKSTNMNMFGYSTNKRKINNLLQYSPNRKVNRVARYSTTKVNNVTQYRVNRNAFNAAYSSNRVKINTNQCTQKGEVNLQLYPTKHLVENKLGHSTSSIENTGELQPMSTQTMHSEVLYQTFPSGTVKPSHSVLPLMEADQHLSDNSHPTAGPVSRVHVNPQFLNCKALPPDFQIGDRIVTDEVVSKSLNASVIHVNPKMLAQMVHSNKEKANIPSSKNKIFISRSLVRGPDKQNIPPALPVPTETVSKLSTQLLIDKTNKESLYLNGDVKKAVNENAKTVVPDTDNSKKFCTSAKGKSMSLQTPKRRSSQNSSLMAVSRTKLVRVPLRIKKNTGLKSANDFEGKSVESADTRPQFIDSKLVGKSMVKVKDCHQLRSRRVSFTSNVSSSVKIAKLVCSKYRIRNLPTTTASNKGFGMNKPASSTGSKYKIDRRIHKVPKRLKKVKKYSLKYENIKRDLSSFRKPGILKLKECQTYPVNGFSFTSNVWCNAGFSQPRKLIISHRRLCRIGSSSCMKRQKAVQNAALVRIGGVLYKTSRTKLTRSKDSGSNPTPQKTNTVVRKRKCTNGHIVYVHGNKFIMDSLGKTLKRIPNKNRDPLEVKKQNISIKRLDIGGVTFVQKSSDVLMRTNTHNTRNLLSQAKQKSIALLTKKMRKNNQPCMFYRRFGKCSRFEKGTCQMLHDPKHIAVCKRFLQGKCEVTGCLLSHDVVPEKMPTCRFFLEGCCVRDNCPYLHVKVNAKAVICQSFLQGYCPDGPRCKKRHVYLCPEFEQKGTCHKGKYCPYPHKVGVKAKKTMSKVKCSSKKAPSSTVTTELERKRYYQSDIPNSNCKLGGTENECEKTLKDTETANHLLVTTEECSEACSSVSHGEPNVHGIICQKEDSDNEPKPKRPKLGWLPSYIALDSKRDQ